MPAGHCHEHGRRTGPYSDRDPRYRGAYSDANGGRAATRGNTHLRQPAAREANSDAVEHLPV